MRRLTSRHSGILTGWLSVALDSSYGALGHEIRRSMLELLRGDELRVPSSPNRWTLSLTGASKHIRALEDAGLIRRTVVGREHFLSLDARPLKPAAEWIDRYRATARSGRAGSTRSIATSRTSER